MPSTFSKSSSLSFLFAILRSIIAHLFVRVGNLTLTYKAFTTSRYVQSELMNNLFGYDTVGWSYYSLRFGRPFRKRLNKLDFNIFKEAS